METGRRSARGIRRLSFALVAGALALAVAGSYETASIVTSIGCVEAKGHRLLVAVLVTSAKTEGVGISTIEKAASAGVARVIAARGA